jgi:uncharacterized integral membrane protein
VSDTSTTTSEGGRRISFGLVMGLLAAIALVLFIVQNTGKQRVEFLWLDGQFPLFLLVLITAALSVVATLVVTWWLRRND